MTLAKRGPSGNGAALRDGLHLAKRRAEVRWNRLVGSPGARIEKYMKPRLSHEQWAAFVAHAHTHYRDSFVRAFIPESGILKCVGTEGELGSSSVDGMGAFMC